MNEKTIREMMNLVSKPLLNEKAYRLIGNVKSGLGKIEQKFKKKIEKEKSLKINSTKAMSELWKKEGEPEVRSFFKEIASSAPDGITAVAYNDIKWTTDGPMNMGRKGKDNTYTFTGEFSAYVYCSDDSEFQKIGTHLKKKFGDASYQTSPLNYSIFVVGKSKDKTNIGYEIRGMFRLQFDEK